MKLRSTSWVIQTLSSFLLGCCGALALSACAGGAPDGDDDDDATADAGPRDEPGPIPGDPEDPFASALEYLAYEARPQDFADDASDLPGLRLSFNTLIAIVDADATIGAVNTLLLTHEATLVGMVPDPTATVGAIVALRLPTTSHAELDAVLPTVVAEPLLAGVHRDRLQQEPLSLPTGGGAAADGWTWERDDEDQPGVDANWGLEHMRVPQAWAFNALAASGDGARVGVLDVGFAAHPDLEIENASAEHGSETASNNDHGMHVAGTIAARFGNGLGVDGVNPFAHLTVRRIDIGSVTWGMIDFIEDHPTLHVINASLGANWYLRDPAVNPNTDAAAQNQVGNEGLAFAAFMSLRMENALPTPYVIAAAGNDSSRAVFGGAHIEARWSSPYAAGAILYGAPRVVVVEAVGRSGDVDVERADFSNKGGHLSAPGRGIVSLGFSAPTLELDGTSMAAPHVTGLLSLLLAQADGTLSIGSVLDAITASARAVATPDTAPEVDAFAAALALDSELGEPRMMRHLVDVDDGTPDGNTRVDLRTLEPVTSDTALTHLGASLGPVGDDRVDMRDFRRFRDALLATEASFELALDGAADHPKRDLNNDGIVASAAQENVFARFDYNGDGIVHRSATRFVGGLLQQDTTDLGVLQFLFSEDEEVTPADLPVFLDSGDVHIDVQPALEAGAAAVEIDFTAETTRTVRFDLERPAHVLTLPVGSYSLAIRHFDSTETLIASNAGSLTVSLGGDALRIEELPSQGPAYYLDVTFQTDDFASCGGEPLVWHLVGRVEDRESEERVQGAIVAFSFDGVPIGTGVTDATGTATSNPFTIDTPGLHEIEMVLDGETTGSTQEFNRVQDCNPCPGAICERTMSEDTVCVSGNDVCVANGDCDCKIENCSSDVSFETDGQGNPVFRFTCGPL